MLMISPLNRIEPVLSFSKEETVLVLLEHQDPFKEYAIFESSISLDSNLNTIKWIVNFHTSP